MIVLVATTVLGGLSPDEFEGLSGVLWKPPEITSKILYLHFGVRRVSEFYQILKDL